jgi:hypothetical protein
MNVMLGHQCELELRICAPSLRRDHEELSTITDDGLRKDMAAVGFYCP